MAVHVAVTTAPAGSNTAITLTTRLDNGTPAGQSQFVAGPFPGVGVSYGGYSGLVATNLPAAASSHDDDRRGPAGHQERRGAHVAVGGADRHSRRLHLDRRCPLRDARQPWLDATGPLRSHTNPTVDLQRQDLR